MLTRIATALLLPATASAGLTPRRRRSARLHTVAGRSVGTPGVGGRRFRT